MKRITRRLYNELRLLPWNYHREDPNPELLLNDGCFMIVDESGKGLLGVLKMENDVLASATTNMFGRRGELELKYYAPVAEVWRLENVLAQLNAECMVQFQGANSWRLKLSQDNVVFSSETLWHFDEFMEQEKYKSLLIELDISLEGFRKILDDLGEMDLQFVMYFYSPGRGLHLPEDVT